MSETVLRLLEFFVLPLLGFVVGIAAGQYGPEFDSGFPYLRFTKIRLPAGKGNVFVARSGVVGLLHKRIYKADFWKPPESMPNDSLYFSIVYTSGGRGEGLTHTVWVPNASIVEQRRIRKAYSKLEKLISRLDSGYADWARRFIIEKTGKNIENEKRSWAFIQGVLDWTIDPPSDWKPTHTIAAIYSPLEKIYVEHMSVIDHRNFIRKVRTQNGVLNSGDH